MDELKARTMEVINQVNQNWVDKLKEAEEKGEGLDLSNMMGLYSKEILRLYIFFRESEQRNKSKKK